MGKTLRFLAVAPLAALVLTTGVASAAPSRPSPQPTKPLLTNTVIRGPFQVDGDSTFNGSVSVNMTSTGQGLTIKAGDTLNHPIQVTDKFNNPIFSVLADGGAGVTGDNLFVTPRGNFDRAVVIRYDGSITFGGCLPDSTGQIHCDGSGPTLYGGSADPNLTPPAHVSPFKEGDRYFWKSSVYGYPTLVYNGLFWQNPS